MMTPSHFVRRGVFALALCGVLAGPAAAQSLMVQPPLDEETAAEIAAEATSAEGFSSATTDLDFAQCTIMRTDDFGSVWACPGYRGLPVRVSEGDRRFTLSFGLESAHEKAAEQSPKPFNQIGNTIEWRLKSEAGRQKPLAAITRYFLDGEQKREVLAVTQISEGATCHTAYVDVLSNSDAEALARQAADAAGSFDCAGEPELVGEFSAW